jgi:ubiquinone/menaquinone biosynthesis C-methylase UbiE
MNNLLPAIEAHYSMGSEHERLSRPKGQLEFIRTQELILRFLPPPPAIVLDVGGGTGPYSYWLAKKKYEVHLIDPIKIHIEQATVYSDALASINLGDARSLPWKDKSVDVVLMLGPLYHLVKRGDRIKALLEAHRVLRKGGVLFAVGISRFSSALDGLFRGFLEDDDFFKNVKRCLKDGQQRSPKSRPDYFTTAFFHHPNELEQEIREAKFKFEKLLGVDGPGWMMPNFNLFWSNPDLQVRLLAIIRSLEEDSTIVGQSAHMLAVGRKT